jgi:glycosyltransferase involved in cell wall biosynthesis
LLSFARSLDRDRFDITMLATDSGDSRLLGEWRDGVDRIYDLGQFAERAERRWVIESLAHSWRWDCLVLQNDLAAYEAAVSLGRSALPLKKVDILHNLHDDWDLHASTAEAAVEFDRRVVISEAGRAELLRHGSPAEAIRLIRTGIDLQRFDRARFDREQCRREWGAAADERIILFIGHLIERKRPLLLTAIDRELQQISGFPRYRLIVVGDGPELPKLERYVSASGAGQRFQLLGQREDVPALLAAADALVVPSHAEGTPLVISEALAMKTPVVAARVGAIDEILPASCGMLTDRDASAREFAQALSSLFSNEAARQRMGEAGREFVERRHNAVQVQREYRELIDELLAEDGEGRWAESLHRFGDG